MRYTEQQVTSELLDQPVFVGEPKKLFIFSTPRSGSYLLCRYLINAGLGIPHEYFNPVNMRQIAPRFGLGAAIEGLKWRPRSPMDRLPFAKAARTAETKFLEKYAAALVPRRCQQGVFAAKLNFGQYTKVLDNPVGWKLLSGGVFVHLYREDLLGQAVSTNIARLTGRWSIDDAITTAPAADVDLSDASALDRTVEELAKEDLEWRVFLARNGISAISVSYEKVCHDPFGLVVTLAHRLGIDPGLLRRGYSEPLEPVQHDPALPRKSEVVRNYLRRMQQVKSASVLKPSQPENPALASESSAAT
ncbi:MAG TPA: Stf0 family sulfotransferase [Acetobacteraceae bacterium]|jgi:LPS sulfotransferase NodH|nr:Stf0 family sulfotransferase [Acetobacteraceae bacterium]